MDFDENIQVENLQVENFLDCQFIKTEKYIYTLMPLVVLQNPELFKEKHLKEYYYFLGEHGLGLEDKTPNFIYFVMRQFINKILFSLKNICYLRASATESDKIELLKNEYDYQRRFYANCLTP